MLESWTDRRTRTVRSAHRPRLAASLAALAGALACSGGPSSILLEGREGNVVDRDTRAPIGGAEVYQVYRGGGLFGEPRAVSVLRWTRSDERGLFRFEPRRSSDLEGAPSNTAEYGFYHASYGLVRRGSAMEGAPLILEAQRPDAAKLESERLQLCGSRPPDRIVEEVARSHCGAK